MVQSKKSLAHQKFNIDTQKLPYLKPEIHFFQTNMFGIYVDVSKNRGGPPKWMMYFMENLIKTDKMDDLGGFPIFLETPM